MSSRNNRREERGERREGRKALALALVVIVVVVLNAWLQLGCASTVTPRVVRDSVASWDGTNQNSGFIGYLPDGSGLLTSQAFHRYQGLVHDFGGRFLPPIVYSTDGVTPTGTNTFIIDPQHLEYFATMNRWRKQAGTH